MVSTYINRENLDRATPVPLHYQVQQLLRKAIADGVVRVGEPLPPEATLAAEAGLARSTVRQALAQLVREGLLRRERGRGTFLVAKPEQIHVASALQLGAELAREGSSTELRVLEISTFALPPEVQARFGEHAPDTGVRISRLRLHQGQPVAVETIFLQAVEPRYLDQTASDDQALYAMLEREYGYRVTHAEEMLGLTRLDEATARLLELSAGDTVLYLERRTQAGERPVELRHSYLRADRVQFHAQLSRQHLTGG